MDTGFTGRYASKWLTTGRYIKVQALLLRCLAFWMLFLFFALQHS